MHANTDARAHTHTESLTVSDTCEQHSPAAMWRMNEQRGEADDPLLLPQPVSPVVEPPARCNIANWGKDSAQQPNIMLVFIGYCVNELIYLFKLEKKNHTLSCLA